MTEARARSGEAHPQREFHVRSAPPIQSGKTGIVLDFTGHSAAAVRPAGMAPIHTSSVSPPAPLPDPKAQHRSTTDRDGISALEGYRFLGAVEAMQRLIDHRPDLSLYTAFVNLYRRGRDTFRQKLGEVQREEVGAALWVTVRERGADKEPNEHEHLLLAGSERVADRMRDRKAFQGAGQGLLIKPLKDRFNQVSYRLMELSPAGYAELSDGKHVWRKKRYNRTYPLPSGGDRVWLSEELKAFALEAGLIEPWTQSKRRDKPGNDYPAARRRPRLTTTAPVLADQVVLPFIEPQVRRPVARLRDFGGGLMPAVVAGEIEFRRHQLGWSQRELARRCGIGQPQLANVLRGHDPLSAWATRRLRDALRDGLLAEAA